MSEHVYRTLVRVTGSTAAGELVVEMPTRPDVESLVIPASSLPVGLVQRVAASPDPSECSVFLHVMCNLNTEDAEDLRFMGPWEMGKVNVHSSGAVERLDSASWQ